MPDLLICAWARVVPRLRFETDTARVAHNSRRLNVALLLKFGAKCVNHEMLETLDELWLGRC